MKSFIILVSVVLVSWSNVIALNLPGPRVYVVTPSPRPKIDEGRSVPFYYHNWMRRMDNDFSAQNTTTSTTTAEPKVKTPDLIFAEFESDSSDNMKKSIRKLLEKEKVLPKTTTTTTTTTYRPIYVPDEDFNKEARVVNYGLPINMKEEDKLESNPSDSTNYFSMYNNLYENLPSPVFLPSTTQSTTTIVTTPETNKVENIWHIIDSEKGNQYSDNWHEVPIESTKDKPESEHKLPVDEYNISEQNNEEEIDENFSLPGIGTNPGNAGENESRAIRTDQNIRFPYVNLKPFLLKNNKKPLNNLVLNQKKGNNLMTSLDNFHELRHPVRGEAQDIVPMRDTIDRYNPAQPYLPPKDYGSSVSKQSSISSPQVATANLVPPPPPPAPKLTDNDFPVLTNYESFPPYAGPSFDSAPSPVPPPLPPQKPPIQMYSPPVIDTSDDSDANGDSDNLSDNAPPNVGYRYKPPAPPVQQFFPTLPPVSKPFNGYSYDKPPMADVSPMKPSMKEKPDFHGYHYSKPEPAPPSHDDMPPTYGLHDAPPSFDHDYPELHFQKHHGDTEDSKGSDDINGMVPPPPADMGPADHGPPMDDHGFPSDFPGDLKFHHEIDDHDFYHYHHHHPTTTTTEMPRVNRYSYYYLGKKLYYLPLYFSVYFIVYVGALIIKAVLRHKIVYPNSWRPNGTTASFFSKRSVDEYLSNDNLHEVTGKVTHAIATAAEKYLSHKSKNL